MITISTLQSQIALNRNYLKTLEDGAIDCRLMKRNLRPSALNRKERLESNELELQSLSKQIKQYAKLQRALKSELAYRIMYNREMRCNNMEQYQLK